MRFLVERTSEWNDESHPPCPEATLRDYIYIDERTKDDPAKIHVFERNPQKWYAEGQNHRVEAGHIKRDFLKTAWFVDIESLEELLDFVARYGKLIVAEANFADELYLEIYDAYRE